MRGATSPCRKRLPTQRISIHAPHAGRDVTHTAVVSEEATFQSTRPMRGATFTNTETIVTDALFQSTRPMRGATIKQSDITANQNMNFNPRAPCGARHAGPTLPRGRLKISIHAPHAGRDVSIQHRRRADCRFQSTRPMRGATRTFTTRFPPGKISIHAPHAGRDLVNLAPICQDQDFNPRAPCGARLPGRPCPADG